MTIVDQLLELQATDTAADQLRHRLANLPELDAAKSARRQLVEWEATRTRLRQRLDELDRSIEEAEREAHEIDEHRTRLEGQLRTVIAPREAEALQHEIATLGERRDGIDERELVALEEQAQLDDDLVAHVALEESLRETLTLSDGRLGAAQADLEAELAALDTTRERLRSTIDAGLLERYDRLRAQLGGAVARLVGTRCDGCHLDLSPAEIDAIKAVPADELPECPQCTRMLVR